MEIMEAIQTEEYKGYKINIYPDELTESPREWDNLGHMICFHSQYLLGDEHGMNVEELKEIVAQKDTVSLPLYLYDHSGITMRTSPFSCPWDSGQVGYIFVTREEILKEYTRKKMSKNLVSKVIQRLNSEVQLFNGYITGEVYSFAIENAEGDIIDSCGGFLGDPEEYMLPEARNIIDSLTKEI